MKGDIINESFAGAVPIIQEGYTPATTSKPKPQPRILPTAATTPRETVLQIMERLGIGMPKATTLDESPLALAKARSEWGF